MHAKLCTVIDMLIFILISCKIVFTSLCLRPIVGNSSSRQINVVFLIDIVIAKYTTSKSKVQPQISQFIKLESSIYWLLLSQDIGVSYDEHPSFTSHVSRIVTKTTCRAKCILKGFASRNRTLCAFCTFVRLLLDYSSVIWNHTTKRH